MAEQADPGYLDAALEVLRLRLRKAETYEIAEAERHRDQIRKSLDEQPLDRIARSFGLTDFERDILLMCAGVELDTPFAHICAAAQGDGERTYATFALALTHFPGPRWDAASPAGTLRRLHLVSLVQQTPSTGPWQITERTLHALLGNDYLDPEVEACAGPSLLDPGSLPISLGDAAEFVAARLAEKDDVRILLHGRPSGDLRAAAMHASRRAGLSAIELTAHQMPEDAKERHRLVRLCEREHRLSGICWVFDLDGLDASHRRTVLDLVRSLGAPTMMIAREPPGDLVPGTTALAVGQADAQELRRGWQLALGADAASLAGWIDQVAGQFSLSVDAMTAAVDEARHDGQATPEALGPHLWGACRRRARPTLDDLAERIEPRADWADVVLPSTHHRTLRQIAAHLRHRLVVLDDWGFAGRTGRGIGTAALFAGPSGTGKTLAAEVVAGALQLDLYRVDLSHTVSKYIGETEKNLGKVFDAAEAGGAVLLFDEADALFGKRGEVKDGLDRYANMEVGYLLQRIEAFRGLTILTTNLKDMLDPAFLRRLRFVLQFPFPDAAARREIWRRVFPERTPTEGLDLDALARLSVPGGTIHSIALAAAFLAADAGRPVGMEHVLTATRTEYAKLERPLTASELADWQIGKNDE